MNDPYSTWNQDLLYSSEIEVPTSQFSNENLSSPVRAPRFEQRDSIIALSLYLTPTTTRSPLQPLSETPEGLLYSPFHARDAPTN